MLLLGLATGLLSAAVFGVAAVVQARAVRGFEASPDALWGFVTRSVGDTRTLLVLAAYLVGSGHQQLMVSNDTAYVPALLAPHPDWQGAYDLDGPLAVRTRRALIDRVIAEKMMVCGAHFPFPGAGTFAKDGAGYAFVPVKA